MIAFQTATVKQSIDFHEAMGRNDLVTILKSYQSINNKIEDNKVQLKRCNDLKMWDSAQGIKLNIKSLEKSLVIKKSEYITEVQKDGLHVTSKMMNNGK